MLGILAESFMTATRTDTTWMRDARPQDGTPVPDGAAPRRHKWYYWRGRPWRPVDPRKL